MGLDSRLLLTGQVEMQLYRLTIEIVTSPELILLG